MKKKSEDLKNIKKDDEKQSQRFVEAARELESDETGKSFDKAIKMIAPEKKSGKASD